MKIKPENKLQQECLKYLAEKYPENVIHSVPNEIPYPLPPKVMMAILSILRKMGMLPGSPDLIMHAPNGICYCIEFKTETGTKQKEQLQFQKRMEKINGNYYIVRSLDELKLKL
jgi:hypothetical protein